jgi:hypothetical protein
MTAVTFLMTITLAGTVAWGEAEYGFDLRGGLTVPVGDFNDAFDLGFGLQSSLYIEFSPVAAAGLGVGYNRFSLNTSDAPDSLDFDGGQMSFLSICPEIRFMVGTGDMATFAFVVGAGLYRVFQADIDITNVNDPSDNLSFGFDAVNKFGINTAGKVVFPVNDSVKIGVEAMWHMIFTEEDPVVLDTTSGPVVGVPSPDYNTSFFGFMAVLVITTGT